MSPLGPALFRVNAVLGGETTSFEEAEPELDCGGLIGLGPPGEPAEPLALQRLRLPLPTGPAVAGGEAAAEGAHGSLAREITAV